MFLATFAAVLGNFSFGYALVYTSPVIPALEHSSDPDLRLSKTQASWFGVRPVLWEECGGELSWGPLQGPAHHLPTPGSWLAG